MFQASQCMLAVTLVVGLICRFMVIAETIEKFRSTYFEEFVDVSGVEYWDKVSVRIYCQWTVEDIANKHVSAC